MRLVKARVQNYRSIRDTGEFEVESNKTILVGPNEAGKTTVLQALQQINRPEGIKPFDQLRDYLRALLNDITTGRATPAQVPVATGWFALDEDDRNELPPSLQVEALRYRVTRRLDDSCIHGLEGAPDKPSYGDLEGDLARLARHLDGQVSEDAGKPSTALRKITSGWRQARRCETAWSRIALRAAARRVGGVVNSFPADPSRPRCRASGRPAGASAARSRPPGS